MIKTFTPNQDVPSSGVDAAASRSALDAIKQGALLMAGAYASYRILVAAAPVVRYAVKRTVKRTVGLLGSPPRLSPGLVRNVFRDMPIALVNVSSQHSHPGSAAHRNAAGFAIDQIAAELGLTAFFYQMSKSDQRAGRSGSRKAMWAKDLQAEERLINPPGDALLAMCDVDFYVDMPSVLLAHSEPVIISTFTPDSVCKNGSEISYTFNQDNEVDYRVTGGANYKHRVWDYSQDVYLFSGWTVPHGWSHPTYVSRAVLCERRELGADRGLVLLTTIRTFYGLQALAASYFLSGSSLERLSVNHDGWMVLDTFRRGKAERHIARSGTWTAASLTLDEADGLVSVAAETAHLGIGTIGRHVPHLSPPQQAIVAGYYKAMGHTRPAAIYPVEWGPRHYEAIDGRFHFDSKPSVIAFMRPLVDAAFAPLRSISNECWAIDERITKVRSDAQPTSYLQRAIREFASEFPKHALHPTTVDAVYTNQSRPTQVAALDDGMMGGKPDRRAKCFQKSEAYGSIKPPRIITTINAVDKLHYSRFVYSASGLIKEYPWYAFGRSPADVSLRVVDVARDATSITMSDFSRMDGRVSAVLRTLERVLFLHLFHPRYHAELLDLMASQTNLRATMPLGTKYDTSEARLSGSPETSLSNSIATLFIYYLAVRATRGADGKYVGHAAAWHKVNEQSIVGGDDGILADVTPAAVQVAAGMVGQVAKANSVERGSYGVNFLNRYYGPDLWSGTPVSHTDVLRALGSLHVTSRQHMHALPSERAYAKALGYHLSDRHTPILGEWANAVVELTVNPPGAELVNRISYRTRFSYDVQFQNEKSEWINDAVMHQMQGFNYDQFTEWLSRALEAKDIGMLLEAPMFYDPPDPEPQDRPVAVDGEIIAGTSPPPAPSSKARRPRRGKRKPGKRPRDKTSKQAAK